MQVQLKSQVLQPQRKTHAIVTYNHPSHRPAGCHMGGGNIVERNATLFPADLERNGMSGVDEIFKLVYGGKGKMPGFGLECQPK